jgi:membrane-bound lytic murein transglycosylase MltF
VLVLRPLAVAALVVGLVPVLAPRPARADLDVFEEKTRVRFDEVWKGDLDGIVERRRLRVLITYSFVNYFLDGGRPRGLTYEFAEEFARKLNAKLNLRSRPIRVVYIPVRHDEMLTRLAEGRGDIAASLLTITEQRAALVDSSRPFSQGIREVVVGAPGEPPVRDVDDLAGREVWVRRSSSFHESLAALNARFAAEGRPPVRVVPVDEVLETEDILELVAAGSVPLTVVDEYAADFWKDVHREIVVYPDAVLRDDGKIAWALRKGTPKLKAEVDAFAHAHRAGTLYGNVLVKRYLESNPWVKNARAERSLGRLQGMIALFERYAERYDFDWMMVAAQAFQESGLDQSLRSSAGAVGVMQILPSTAASPEVGIPDIEVLENNIHAGTKYLRVLVNHYFDDPELD